MKLRVRLRRLVRSHIHGQTRLALAIGRLRGRVDAHFADNRWDMSEAEHHEYMRRGACIIAAQRRLKALIRT